VTEALIEYDRDPRPTFSAIDEMWVERGNRDDWNVLHDLHYKAEALPAGSRFWRCVDGDGRVVGIVCSCSPALLLAPRHVLLPKLKPGRDTALTNRYRAQWINKNMRRAARIVTDTLYRGVGVSYRMVNLASRLEGVRYMEIQSSMSKFNPFDQKAGFVHAPLQRSSHYDAGIRFFRGYFDSNPQDYQALMAEFDAMPATLQARTLQAMREFYYSHSAKEKTGPKLGKGTSRVEGLSAGPLFKELQQLVFASPVYGLYTNPDLGRPLPERLPLSAYDLQKPHEPLRLDLL